MTVVKSREQQRIVAVLGEVDLNDLARFAFANYLGIGCLEVTAHADRVADVDDSWAREDGNSHVVWRHCGLQR